MPVPLLAALVFWHVAAVRARAQVSLRAKAVPVLIAVNSQADHVEQRELARSSWVKAVLESGPPAFAPRVVFAVAGGSGGSAGPVTELPEPGVLQFPVPEGYTTLPQKTAALLRWARDQPEEVLVAVDDDVFVHADALWKQLRTLPAVGYAGYTQHMPTPQNADPNSKWFVNASARAHLPDADYVTGQFKVFTREALRLAVDQMAKVPLQPFGVGPPEQWLQVEDQYVGALFAAAGVKPLRWQTAVAPQCCTSDDVFTVLDGDTYFVKTQGNSIPWDATLGLPDSVCRYHIAAQRSRAKPGAQFCLTSDELSLARCPPHKPEGREAQTDRVLRSICR